MPYRFFEACHTRCYQYHIGPKTVARRFVVLFEGLQNDSYTLKHGFGKTPHCDVYLRFRNIHWCLDCSQGSRPLPTLVLIIITQFVQILISCGLTTMFHLSQHFLTPVIASLDTPHPLLSRAELTSVFSNFIDIWNLHRSFFSSLTDHLHASTSNGGVPPPLSPVLLSHFPYLSLYTPFVTSFHTSVASLTGLLTSNAAFSAFVAKQETDPRCGKLKLRDWLLTIVQRCPRYLLLLKDLIGCTDSEDSERVSLMAVHTLVSKSE